MPAQMLLAAFAFAHLAVWLLTGESSTRSNSIHVFLLLCKRGLFPLMCAKLFWKSPTLWHLVLAARGAFMHRDCL